jgi:hypothetical protein
VLHLVVESTATMGKAFPLYLRGGGASGSGRVVLSVPSSTQIRGRITVTTFTPATYFDLRENIDKKNKSQWRVTLYGTKSISFPLP